VSRATIRAGAAGERRAANWYLDRGYEVLDRNWRCASGEIDLVCARTGVLVICEVKTRHTDAFGSPLEAVTFAKQRRLRRLAGAWLAQHPRRWAPVRFDVVAIAGAGLEVIEGAF
jgi:putative endonuclease